ncbi:hypothetical protein Taro_018813 [Colocasia esculenta]|uniref:Cytochrome P450 n=1 Tax=Colocasia esculenta TaxID=4460 RepID=A0A843V076_COLES|nr:hypothetical protein [Colocasia esculenta]
MDAVHFSAAHPEGLLAIATSLVFFFVFLVRLKGSAMGGIRSSLVDLPVVGMLPSILLNLHRVHDWAAKVLEDRGCTTWVRGPWLSGMVYLFTSDPAVAKYVTSTRYKNFVRGTRFREILEPVGNSILASDFNESWRVRRRLTLDLMHQPEFQHSHRRTTHRLVEGKLLPFLADLARQGDAVDMQDVLQRFTFDLVCSTFFGVDLGSLSADFPTVPFARAVSDAEEVIVVRFALPPAWWKLMRWLRIGPERKMAAAMRVIDEFIYQHIASKKAELCKDGRRTDNKTQVGEDGAAVDLLRGFIDHQSAGEAKGRTFESDRSLRDTMVEMVVAGWHTTSVSISWLYWLVATHPSVEARILEELASVVRADGGDGGRHPGYTVFDVDELHGCVYLDAVIHETLRLFAPLPLNPFCAVEKDVLPTGEVVKPGTIILLDLYAVGRMEKNWGKDAGEFKPERWITEEGKLIEENSYKFAAFGSGPKMCLGRRVGLAVTKAVAASAIYNFRFNVAEGHRPLPSSSVVLHMKNGLMGSLRERFPR